MAAGFRKIKTDAGLDNEYAICVVEQNQVTIQALILATDTYMRVVYSATSPTLESDTTTTTGILKSGNSVARIVIGNLTAGQKYYYKVEGSADNITWDIVSTISYFRIPPVDNSSFKFMIIADAHLNGYCNNSGRGIRAENYAKMLGVAPTIPDGSYLKESLEFFSSAIKTQAPDFLIWLGDDVFTHDGEGSDYGDGAGTCIDNVLDADVTISGVDYNQTNLIYTYYAGALAALGIPCYFANGNHERDYFEFVNQPLTPPHDPVTITHTAR